MSPAHPGAPLTPSSLSRKCSNCSSPLQSVGVKAIPTLEGVNHPPGVFVVEAFHCAHCGKVEFFTPH